MRLRNIVLCILLSLYSSFSLGSDFQIRARDFALTALPSDAVTLAYCALPPGGYAPPDTCGYVLWPTGTILSQSSEHVVVDLSAELGGFPDAALIGIPDLYINFTEAGSSTVTDYLRVQFDFALQQLLVSLVSGVNALFSPIGSLLVGEFDNIGANQVIDVTGLTQFDKLTWASTLLPVYLAVQPAALPEPGMPVVLTLFAAALLGLRRRP